MLCGVEFLRREGRKAGISRKRIHQAGVEGLLLVGVVVILVCGCRLRRAQPEGVYGVALVDFYIQEIRVALEQHGGQAIYLWCFRARFEGGFMGRVERVWISPEVVIEGDILVKDHHQMLDRRRGLLGILRWAGSASQRDQQEELVARKIELSSWGGSCPSIMACAGKVCGIVRISGSLIFSHSG